MDLDFIYLYILGFFIESVINHHSIEQIIKIICKWFSFRDLKYYIATVLWVFLKIPSHNAEGKKIWPEFQQNRWIYASWVKFQGEDDVTRLVFLVNLLKSHILMFISFCWIRIDIIISYSTHSPSFFSKPVAYFTHNAPHPCTSWEYMRLCLQRVCPEAVSWINSNKDDWAFFM